MHALAGDAAASKLRYSYVPYVWLEMESVPGYLLINNGGLGGHAIGME